MRPPPEQRYTVGMRSTHTNIATLGGIDTRPIAIDTKPIGIDTLPIAIDTKPIV